MTGGNVTMRPSLTILALLALVPRLPAADPPTWGLPVAVGDFREDHEGTLKSLRERRERLAATLGPSHPDVVTVDRAIAFREAYIPLSAKLEQKKSEVLDLEAEIRRLVRQYAADTPQAPPTACPGVDQKLDAILQRLDQLEKRLGDRKRIKPKKAG
jgi:hypothetical protein